MNKRFGLFILLFFTLFLVSCRNTEDIEISKIEISNVEGTGTLANPFLIKMEVGDSFEGAISVEPKDVLFDLTFKLGLIENGKFVESGAVGIELKTDNSKTKLSFKANTKGEYAVGVFLKGKELAVYAKVTVSEKEVIEPIDVLVSSITFATISEGEGTLASPYLIDLAHSQEGLFPFAVLPNNATNKTINWELLVKEEENLVAPKEGEEGISLTSSATRLTIEALLQGSVTYIKGTAADASKAEVYLKVNVSDFTAVEEIVLTGLLEDPKEEQDFVFETALFTTWDMSGEQLERREGLLAGTDGPGAGQAPLNLLYWPNMYKFEAEVLPENATNPTLNITYSKEGIFRLNTDGTYEALAAGETVVTVSSLTNPEVKVTIKVVVHDSLYHGILVDDFNETAVSNLSEWNFDGNPDNLGSLPLLAEWNNVFLQTNTVRGGRGIDGNQKIFYLGQPDRVYGIALESRVDSGDINLATALTWNKVFIAKDATTIDLVIGNNDKVHNEYRVVLVDAEKNVYVVQDWTKLETPNDSKRVNDLVIPEGAKDKTLALVIEQRLTEKKNNGEVHIKGIWINQYVAVTGISLPASEGTYGQGAKFNLAAFVEPTSATEKGLLYSVDEPSITVSNQGLVSIAANTPVGNYIITIVSVDNPLVSVEYKLTVDTNVPTTIFELVGLSHTQKITATYDSNNKFTDKEFRLVAKFNENASNQEYTYQVEGTSVKVENGKISFIGIGEAKVTFVAAGNQDLVIEVDFDVVEYDEANVIVKGLNKTAAENSLPSSNKIWNNGALAREWTLLNVDSSHGGSKIAEYGEANDGKMIFEGHATKSNLGSAINMGWIKLLLDDNDNSFLLQVRSHDDDRVLESSNFRVLLVDLANDNEVVELIGWTTVASRLKQKNEWYHVALDISDYQGKEVILVIEQTGSVQNNGNWPKNSDSAAGAYLHLRGLGLSDMVAPSLEELYTHRLYARTNDQFEVATDWVANSYYYNKNFSNYFGGAFKDEEYQPLVLTYVGKEEDLTALSLLTTSIFIDNGKELNPMFYPWGLYPALNNHHKENDVSYEVVTNDGVISIEENVITPIKEGIAVIVLKALGYAGGEDQAFEIIINVSFDGPGGSDDPEEPVRTKWENKAEIAEDWELSEGSQIDTGVGEGIDLKVTGSNTWSSIYYEVTITKEIASLLFGSRVFHRDGETYPHFFVKVDGNVVRAYGATEDYVYVDTDDIQTHYYDLSEYLGQKVVIEIGVDRGTHAVITNIALFGTEEWNNKTEILEAWALTAGSEMDMGVGEGADLKVTGSNTWSSIAYQAVITPATEKLLFGARVFHRDGETYPHFYVKVDGNIVRAIDATEDYVYVDTDEIQIHYYDLSLYLGQKVVIEIGIDRGTHAVITNIELFGVTEEADESLAWNNKAKIAEAWTLTEGSQIDAGVGEGFDLKVTNNEWSSITYEKVITPMTRVLLFGARVFHRDGETYPHFFVKIDGVVVRALGAIEDYVLVDTDEIQTNYYDLSEYLGRKVVLEIGIDQGTHAVITNIELFGVLEDEDVELAWNNKAEIAEAWTLTEGSQIDAGVGEGFDLKVTDNEWSSITYEKVITPMTQVLLFGARVFHRDGETYPHFFVKINGVVVRAEGATEDYVLVDTDEIQTNFYDLSAYLWRKVVIEIGIDRGTHAVITKIELFGIPEEVDEELIWANKAEIAEAWTLTEGSQIDAGVGEGFDLKVTDNEWSSITFETVITPMTQVLLFGSRVFHRDGETYPHFFVKIDGDVVRAYGVTEDYVLVDTDEIQTNYYDLSEYLGQKVVIEIGIDRGTHAVITNIALKNFEPKGYYFDGKAAIAEAWTLTEGSQIDAGVGEGFDLKVGSGEGWSSIEKEISINPFTTNFSFAARVFHRDGETYPKFVLKVNGEIVRAIDAEEDFVYVDTDDFLTFNYDLSAYLGQEVTIELGITTGTHAVIGSIVLS